MEVYAFNPSIQEARGSLLSFSLAWSTRWAPGQSELDKEILAYKQQQQQKTPKSQKNERTFSNVSKEIQQNIFMSRYLLDISYKEMCMILITKFDMCYSSTLEGEMRGWTRVWGQATNEACKTKSKPTKWNKTLLSHSNLYELLAQSLYWVPFTEESTVLEAPRLSAFWTDMKFLCSFQVWLTLEIQKLIVSFLVLWIQQGDGPNQRRMGKFCLLLSMNYDPWF